MVEARKNEVLVKLQLSGPNTSPICKRVMAADYATLMVQAARLAQKAQSEPEGLRYHDGHDWVMIEDQQDLEFAYDFAAKSQQQTQSIVPSMNGQSAQIIFNIKMKGAEVANNDDAEMADEQQQQVAGKMKGKKQQDKVKGIPRKALKNLINKEFEKQAKSAFEKLLKSEDLPAPDMTAEETEAVHENVACDGCEVCPIVGIRYKCTVRKNYDLCAKCEDRLEQEHPMLKITHPGGAPDVMITMLDEEEPKAAAPEEEKKAEQPQPSNPMEFFQQMMGQHGGRGGRGGGRGGRGGCGPGGRGGWKQMLNQFMGTMGKGGDGNFNPEEFGKKMGELGKQFGEKWQNNTAGAGPCGPGGWNFEGKQGWKHARAVIKRKPEQVFELAPGCTEIAEIEVFNDTYWPWKQGCTLTLADEQPDGCEMPLDVFQVPVDQEVKGKTGITISVPITMGAHVIADANKVHEMNVTFRGPRGQSFGELIPIKVKCVLPVRMATDVEIYKLAIKLNEQLNLGSIDECIKAARECNGDEGDTIKALQRKEE